MQAPSRRIYGIVPNRYFINALCRRNHSSIMLMHVAAHVDIKFRVMEISVRILLVEDSRMIRRENQAALMKAGYEVMCAEDGEAALQMAQDYTP